MISLYILRKNCKKKSERWNIFIIFALTKDKHQRYLSTTMGCKILHMRKSKVKVGG